MDFSTVQVGDFIRVIYHGTSTSMMQVTKIKQYCIEGLDGYLKCRVTKVSEHELRFYGELGPNREVVLRNVQLQKVE